jgi:hypothetical protein
MGYSGLFTSDASVLLECAVSSWRAACGKLLLNSALTELEVQEKKGYWLHAIKDSWYK